MRQNFLRLKVIFRANVIRHAVPYMNINTPIRLTYFWTQFCFSISKSFLQVLTIWCIGSKQFRLEICQELVNYLQATGTVSPVLKGVMTLQSQRRRAKQYNNNKKKNITTSVKWTDEKIHFLNVNNNASSICLIFIPVI